MVTDPEPYTDLGRALVEPERVRALALADLAVLPQAIAGLTHLELLRIHHSGLRELPTWLADLPALHTVILQDNEHLAVIPDDILAMPSLRELTVTRCRSLSHRYRPHLINPVLAEFARAGLDRPARRLHLALRAGDAHTAAGYGIPELVAALNSGLAPVRRTALRLLRGRSDPTAVRVGAGDEVLLAGHTHADRDLLAERLARLGVSVTSEAGPRTRVVVLGELPGDAVPGLVAAGLPVALESQLTGYLDTHGRPYLLEAADADEPVADRLRELLTSPDPGNVGIALDLMRTGGVPPGAFEELLAVACRDDQPQLLREAARTLFAQHAPATTQRALNRLLSRPTIDYIADADFEGMLAGLAGGAVDPVRLAALMLPHRGYRYLIRTPGVPAEAAGRALWSQVRDGTLDLSRWEVPRLPDAVGRLTGLLRLNLGHNGLTAIPEPVLALTTLEALDVSDNPIGAVPDGLDRLTRLHTLTLDRTTLTAFPSAVLRLPDLRRLDLSRRPGAPAWPLPDAIGDLTPLRELRLRGHEFGTLPDSMSRLANLHRLDLSQCRIGRLPESLAELPALRELHLWRCTITDTRRADRVIERLVERGVAVEG